MIDKKEFKKLSAAEKRVAICKDVIKRIINRQIDPRGGNIFYRVSAIEKSDDLNKQKCQVCAKGALFCSWVGNSISKFDFANGARRLDENIGALYNSYPKSLIKLFGRKTLDQIECAFEETVFPWSHKEAAGYKMMYSDIPYDTPRLVAIMQNIIKNNGKFVLDSK